MALLPTPELFLRVDGVERVGDCRLAILAKSAGFGACVDLGLARYWVAVCFEGDLHNAGVYHRRGAVGVLLGKETSGLQRLSAAHQSILSRKTAAIQLAPTIQSAQGC